MCAKEMSLYRMVCLTSISYYLYNPLGIYQWIENLQIKL